MIKLIELAYQIKSTLNRGVVWNVPNERLAGKYEIAVPWHDSEKFINELEHRAIE